MEAQELAPQPATVAARRCRCGQRADLIADGRRGSAYLWRWRCPHCRRQWSTSTSTMRCSCGGMTVTSLLGFWRYCIRCGKMERTVQL